MIVFTVIGIAVVSALVALAFVHGARVKVPWFATINITRAVPKLKAVGWDIKIAGIFGRRLGIGILYGAPPVHRCEADGCRRKFPTKAAAERHEERDHVVGDFS